MTSSQWLRNAKIFQSKIIYRSNNNPNDISCSYPCMIQIYSINHSTKKQKNAKTLLLREVCLRHILQGDRKIPKIHRNSSFPLHAVLDIEHPAGTMPNSTLQDQYHPIDTKAPASCKPWFYRRVCINITTFELNPIQEIQTSDSDTK